MKESMWGYLIIALGVVIIAILVFVQRLTTINEEDYHLSREIMKASMLDAVDYGTYMKTGKLVMSKEKFVAVFTRRFAESVTPDKTYTLNFYDIYEYPPKATVRIGTNSGETSINGNGIDLDLNTFISAILVTSEADGLIKISFSSDNGDLDGNGEINPADILAALNCSDGTCSYASKLASLGGDTTKVDLDDLAIIEQGIMHGYNFGDINKDGKVDSNDVIYIRNYKKNNKSLDLFQRIIGDIDRNGKIETDKDANALSEIISNGKLTISKGDVNGDGMVTAADALLIRDHINSNVVLNSAQLKVADYDGNGTVNQKDINAIINSYKAYLGKL